MLNAANRDGAAAMPSSCPPCQPLAAPCLHARQSTKGGSVNALGLERHARRGCDEGGEGKGRVSHGASVYLSHRKILGECREGCMWELGERDGTWTARGV